VPVAEGIERGKMIRDTKFSPERWEAFSHDFLTLQRQFLIGKKLWYTMLNDRGFNGTPAWITVAKPFAKLVPVEAMKYLGYIDFMLLALGLFALFWAYSLNTSLWVLFFLSVTYSMRWPVLTHVFLRYDWVAALLIAMAVLKKQKWLAGGALCAYAALVRLFPLLWMFGPFALGVLGLLKKREVPKDAAWSDKPEGGILKRVDKRLVMVAVGFLLMAGLGEGLATLNVGAHEVAVHAGNIREHVKPSELSSRRVGFALGLV